MNEFCQDRDLLGLEPGLFLSLGPTGSQLIARSDGQLSGTTFTSASADFTAAGIQAGMVLTVTTTIPSEGRAYEIVSVDSAQQLTVSVLRADVGGSPIAPPAAQNLSFRVITYQVQIHRVSDALAEKLRALAEAAPVAAEAHVDSAQLRQTAAYGTAASVLLAKAESPGLTDPNWAKAERYQQDFTRMQMQLRLAIDADGDGFAEHTRTLGNVTLRRT